MDIRVIWVRREAEYFCNRGWTGFCPTGKSVAVISALSPSLRGALATKIPWGWIAARSEARLRLLKPLNLETTMLLDHPSDEPTAIRTHIGAIFVSLELSRSTWLVTSLSPGKGEKMSKHGVTAGDVAGLMKLFADLRRNAEVRTGESYPIITIQEAGWTG